ncbi:MAG: VOC family protein [Chloroflexi bacterium]|nr:VOC family protein [Chloroflexota bacterium]
MLTNAPVNPTIPVVDMERAKAFYIDKLGLKLASENAGGVIIEAGGGSTLLLFPRAEATKAEHTAAGFFVADVAAEVTALRANGVVFEDIDMPGLKTENGIAHIGPFTAAWFKDTEGNILGIADVR